MAGKSPSIDVGEARPVEGSSPSSPTNNPPATSPAHIKSPPPSMQRERDVEGEDGEEEGNQRIDSDATELPADSYQAEAENEEGDHVTKSPNPTPTLPPDFLHPRYLANLAEPQSIKSSEARLTRIANETEDTGSELSTPPDSPENSHMSTPPHVSASERRRKECEESPRKVACTHTDWCECAVHAGMEKGVGIRHLGEWALAMWSDDGKVSGMRGMVGKGEDGRVDGRVNETVGCGGVEREEGEGSS